MQLPIIEPFLQKRGNSVPMTKRLSQKDKNSRKQLKPKENESKEPSEFKFKIHGKKKNRGFSNQDSDEINTLILNLWESHYIEYAPPKTKKDGKQGKQEKTDGKNTVNQEQQGKENPNQNSSSKKSQSIKPTSEELKIIDLETQAFKGPFYFDFIEDALQFEALYYQLAIWGLIRTPITSSPPVIAQYLLSLLCSHNKLKPLEIINKICNDAPETKIIIGTIEVRGIQIRRDLLLLFRSVNIEEHLPLSKQFYEYLDQMIQIIKKNKNFNLDLAIDDFCKYSQLYGNNQNEYMKHLQKEQHKKHNMCLAYLRYQFLETNDNDINQIGGQSFNIRIPVGDFQSSSLLDPVDILNNKNKFFHDDDWFKHQNKGRPHSEKVLLAWICYNCEVIAEQVSLKLAQITNKKIVLEKVYFEITSELRVCQSCVGMLLDFLHEYVSDLIVLKLHLNKGVSVIVRPDFQLIIVSQFLHESQSVGPFELRQHIKQFKNSKKTIYIETGYAGLITEIYFSNRYFPNKSKAFTQQIDKIEIKNTFFMSDDMENVAVQQVQQQIENQSTSSNKTCKRAEIYDQLITALRQIQKQQQQPIQNAFVQNENTIYQERILQCYQLIWKFYQNLDQPIVEIDVHFFQIYLQYWFVGDYTKDLQIHCYFLSKQYNLGFDDEKETLEQTKRNLNYKNVFDNGNANIKLLLFDYIFFNRYTTEKQQFDILKDCEKNLQQPIKRNIGSIKLFITTNEQMIEKRREINVKIDSKFHFQDRLKQLTAALHKQIEELRKNEEIVTLIEIIICTIQQLSSELKNQLQQQFIDNEGNIKFNFYYMFIRQLSTEQGMNQFLEEQFFLQDPNQIEARYSKCNDQYQISFYDMKEEQLGQSLCFNEEEEQAKIQQK